MQVCEYKNCDNTFILKSNKRFCSRKCKWSSMERRTFKKRRYRLSLESKCSSCGFIPLHICQLDVDHIDGNNKNNETSNLQTLCANCHRLKTYINKDWKK